MLINRSEKVGTKQFKNSKTFINDSQTFDVLYESLEDYNPTKKGKLLIVFDNIIVDMEANSKIKTNSCWIVYKRIESHNKTKRDPLFYHENT